MYNDCGVKISINGCEQLDSVFYKNWTEEELWLLSISFEKLNKEKLSVQNHIEVEVIPLSSYDLLGNHTDLIKWLGANVECTCYPQNSDVTCLPLPCAMNGCGSSSIPNDTELPPLLPVSATSYASDSDSDHRALNNGRNYILAGTPKAKKNLSLTAKPSRERSSKPWRWSSSLNTSYLHHPYSISLFSKQHIIMMLENNILKDTVDHS